MNIDETMLEQSNDTNSILVEKAGPGRPRNRVTRDEQTKKVRPKRIPVSGNRDILTASNIPSNCVARWVNDDENRVMKFLQGGWEFLNDQGVTVGEKVVDASKAVGTVIHRLVGVTKQNTPLYAYLMVIDKELYDEDQQAKMDSIKQTEDEIYQNPHRQAYDKLSYGIMKSERVGTQNS